MNISTSDIITRIADIQLEALHNLQEKSLTVDNQLLCNLFKVSEEEISNALEDYIITYQDIKETPSLISMLNEYQLSICAHILYRMEDDWLLDNSQGVYGAWQILFGAHKKFHPEFNLILR